MPLWYTNVRIIILTTQSLSRALFLTPFFSLLFLSFAEREQERKEGLLSLPNPVVLPVVRHFYIHWAFRLVGRACYARVHYHSAFDRNAVLSGARVRHRRAWRTFRITSKRGQRITPTVSLKPRRAVSSRISSKTILIYQIKRRDIPSVWV